MKTHHFLRSLAALAAAAGLVSCAAPTPQTRIAKDPAAFQALTTRQRELVQQGRVEKGMPRAAVHFAWGRPDRISQWDRSGREVERWTYSSLRPVYVQTFGVGIGWHRHGHGVYHDPGWYGGQDVAWVPYTAAWVEFGDGRVTEWEVGQERR